MSMIAVPEALAEANEVLNGESQSSTFASKATQQNTISGDYSSIIGIDQLGANHGSVLNGGVGSASEVLSSFSEQVNWLNEALQATNAALSDQNSYMARGMDIADEGGATGENSVVFPARPEPRYQDFSFPVPLVMKVSSLAELNTALMSTKIGDASAAASQWRSLGEKLSEIAGKLREAASSIASNNRGEVFDRAVEKINEVASHGEAFAANAQVFAGTLNGMMARNAQLIGPVMSATGIVAAIQDPIEKKAVEEAYLMKFQATLQTHAEAAVPPITNLMSNASVNAAGGAGVDVGMSDIAGRGRLSTAGLQAGAMESVGTGAQASGGGQFGAVENNAAQLAGINPDGLATHAATVGNAPVAASPSIAGTVTPMGGAGLGGGLGTGTGAGGVGDVHSPYGMGIAGTGVTNGRGGAGAGSRAGIGGRMGASAPGAGGLVGRGTAGAGGTGMIGGAKGMGAGLGQASPGVASAVGTPAGGAKTGAAMSAARGTGTMMGGMPVGGAADERQKKGKVRRVTTGIESEGNVKALIGDRAPVVPGVIGSWIRD